MSGVKNNFEIVKSNEYEELKTKANKFTAVEANINRVIPKLLAEDSFYSGIQVIKILESLMEE